MPQAVVDDLEAVNVQEENRIYAIRIPLFMPVFYSADQ
jgi:hypothetical protein